MAKYTILSADSASSLENKVKHGIQMVIYLREVWVWYLGIIVVLLIYKLCINLIRIYIKNKLIIWDFIYHLY